MSDEQAHCRTVMFVMGSLDAVIVVRLSMFFEMIKVRVQFCFMIGMDVEKRSVDKSRHHTNEAIRCGGETHARYSTPNLSWMR